MGTVGATVCKKCNENFKSETPGSTECVACGTGKRSSKGSAVCQDCQPGEAGTPCLKCHPGRYRGENDASSICLDCLLGEFSEKGSASCSKCDLGTYGSSPGNCRSCIPGQYQDDKGESSCKSCQGGKIANDKMTACESPLHKVSADCHPINEYLNDSSKNNMDHLCLSCPLGADCEGDTAWKDVHAKSGWWRLEVAEDRINPPMCLKLHQGVSPPCVFAPCLYPSACQGDQNGTERCDEDKGYKNNCTSNDNDNGIDTTVRCRLCATCKPGYKRTGSKTKCQECPNIHANRGFIALGVFIMFIGSR